MTTKSKTTETAANKGKKLSGIVVSDKMDKTVVVEVVTLKTHPLYKKKYKSSSRYKAHDEKNELKVGDKVIIEESRPLSRDKRWTATLAK